MSKTAKGKNSLHLQSNFNRDSEKPPDGWEMLAIAVVERAIRDYSTAFARVLIIDEHPEYKIVGCFREKEEKILTDNLNKILEWYDSDFFNNISIIDKEEALNICDELIELEKARQEAYYARRYKKLKKIYDETEVYLQIGRGKDSDFFRERHKRL